jgi:hypothetical protein
VNTAAAIIGTLIGVTIGLVSVGFVWGLIAAGIKLIWTLFSGATGLSGEDVADKAMDWAAPSEQE